MVDLVGYSVSESEPKGFDVSGFYSDFFERLCDHSLKIEPEWRMVYKRKNLKNASCTTPEGHVLFVSSLTFNPDGKTLAGGSEDNTTRLWDVITGKHTKPSQDIQEALPV